MKPTNLIVILLVLVIHATGESGLLCAQQRSAPSFELATIDAETSWSFRSLSSAVVASPIVRLGDVVQPLDPNLPAWQRLRHAPIGMLPVGGNVMKIQRAKLEAALRKAEATPRRIEWFGPGLIEVVYQPKATPTNVSPSDGSQQTIAQVAYHPAVDQPIQRSQLPLAEAQRIVRWIELAMERMQPTIAETFQRQIDQQQPSLDSLASIGSVTSIKPLDEVVAGNCRFQVVGRTPTGPVESVVSIQLTPYPQVVVPRTSLARGHRISERDLILQPLATEKPVTGYFRDPSQVVGMEVRGNIRAGQPISATDIGSPILVHRGDLVEVRVLSGGVTVKTNAKSLGDGSESDLVEVETMRPRKRLVARVVNSGLVEIVTRAPAVQYRGNR